MINLSQDEYTPPIDDYWTERIQLYTAQFTTYYTKPQKIWSRLHISEEKFSASKHEIIPIKEQVGKRSYVMMQPYVLEPIFREAQAGKAQAWYYHSDKTIVLWECFFDRRFRRHPFDKDGNMQKLWKGFEHWLIKQFPKATILATPFNDPIAESIDEYQTFLKSLGYSPIAKAAFGKKL